MNDAQKLLKTLSEASSWAKPTVRTKKQTTFGELAIKDRFVRVRGNDVARSICTKLTDRKWRDDANMRVSVYEPDVKVVKIDASDLQEATITEGMYKTCRGCGEYWPCSDSQRKDISGYERAKHGPKDDGKPINPKTKGSGAVKESLTEATLSLVRKDAGELSATGALTLARYILDDVASRFKDSDLAGTDMIVRRLKDTAGTVASIETKISDITRHRPI